MKTERNILLAFILNFAFSVFELIGGAFTGSVSIVSDAIHDAGDTVSIGVAFFLEKKSKKQPDEKYTYGYSRYSVIGSVITTFILLFGSVAVILTAVKKIIEPSQINYNGMIVFAVIGASVNFSAAFFTRDGESLNQKAVNLHMLEDVLGWIVVLIGAVVMKFTDFSMLDPLMSIGAAVFILWNSVKNLKEIAELFLEKVPDGLETAEIREHLLEIDGVLDVHHLHIRSMDGQNHDASVHIVTDADSRGIKEKVRRELLEHGIGHVTLELEREDEDCHGRECRMEETAGHGHHHHHHH
jgi:cobalt-zinc-cadmium efflux system protein